jgi:drug/metabolite transporter (DMT)-like permease
MKQTAMVLPAENSPIAAANTMLAAMAVIGLTDNVVPLLADRIGIWQFNVMRTVISVPLIVLMAYVGFGQVAPRRWGAVALRSALVAVSMLFYFSAVALMPLAQALAGLFTSPIFIVVISVLFLGMRIGKIRILSILIGFTGVLFVLQPDPRDFDLLILVPVAGGLFYALGAIATRTMCAGESTVSMLFGMFIAQAIMGACGLMALEIWPLEVPQGADGFVTRGWVWPVWDILHWSVIHAAGSVLGVFLIIRAYQLGEASFVAVFEYSVMIVGPGFAWLAFGQTINAWQMAGIALIIVAGATIALRSES